MTPKAKTRITFDFDDDFFASIEKLERIVCSSHWSNTLNITTDYRHALLAEFVKFGTIVIDECEYEISDRNSNHDDVELLRLLFGKRNISAVTLRHL
jgi:hypothetical protein